MSEELQIIRSKSDLDILGKIYFEEKNHVYRLKNTQLFSVTQLMKPLNQKTYGEISDSILKTAANRGSNVHYAIEMFNEYGAKECRNDNKPYFDAYLKFAEEHQVKSIASEIKIFHKKLLYAGTIDTISIIDNKVTLMDYKTTVSLHKKLVAVQLAAYLDSLNSYGLTVEQVAVLQLKKDGTYDYQIVEPDLKTFYACMRIKAWENFKD